MTSWRIGQPSSSRVGPDAEQVVGLGAAALLDERFEHRVELRDGAHHVHELVLVGGDRVDAHQPLRPTPHRLPLIVAEAEKVRGELGGERRREFVDEFHLAAFGDRLEEFVDHRLDHRFEALHRLGREAPSDERTLVVVRGIVLGDHVLFVHRDARAVGPQAREHLRVALDLDDRRMVDDGPEGVGFVAPDGPLSAHGAERVVHAGDVAVELGREQIRGSEEDHTREYVSGGGSRARPAKSGPPPKPESTNQRRSNSLMDVPGGPRIGQSDLDTMLAAIAA